MSRTDYTSRKQRFGLYRGHLTDPIRFDSDVKVTMQDLGWRSGGRYLPLQDDMSSVAFWYQTEPHAVFPPRCPTRIASGIREPQLTFR